MNWCNVTIYGEKLPRLKHIIQNIELTDWYEKTNYSLDCVKGGSFVIGYLIFSKADNIDVHFLLLQLFGDLHQLLLVCFDGGSDESNDPDLEQTKNNIRIVLNKIWNFYRFSNITYRTKGKLCTLWLQWTTDLSGPTFAHVQSRVQYLLVGKI